MIASAPSDRIRSAFSGDREVPITTWPRSMSWGTRRMPIAPLAPATNTRIPASCSGSRLLSPGPVDVSHRAGPGCHRP